MAVILAQLENMPDLVLDFLAPPLVYNRLLADATGSALCALFLTAAMEVDWSNNGWFDWVPEQCMSVTGMSADEVLFARGRLIELKVYQERSRRKAPVRPEAFIDYDRILELIIEHVERRKAAMAVKAVTTSTPKPSLLRH
jgi:hypothetical protein